MTDLGIFIMILCGMALIGDIVERILVHKERMITVEEADDMDYIELNGELIPYNEDDQE